MFHSTENNDIKIHIKPKTKMDKPLDADYVKDKKKIKVDKLPKVLPNQSFLWLLIGPPRSGKSTYIESLITAPTKNGKRQSYIGLFDKIIFFTPQISDFENDDLNELPDVYSELNMENLLEAEATAQEVYDNGGQTLMVFDDMGANFRKSHNIQTKLEEICFNHRHIGASIFFSAQTYVSLSPGMRKSARFVTVFAMDTTQERETIMNDLPIRKDNHDALYHYIFENPNDADKKDSLGRKLKHTLYIDKSKLRFPRIMYYKDFDEIQLKK